MYVRRLSQAPGASPFLGRRMVRAGPSRDLLTEQEQEHAHRGLEFARPGPHDGLARQDAAIRHVVEAGPVFHGTG